MQRKLARLLIMVLGLGWLAASRGEASFITIDTPNLVVVRPLSGVINVSLTGSLSFDAGYTNLTSYGTYYPYNSAGQALGPTYYAMPTSALNGGIFTGILVTLQVTSNTALGTYNLSPGSPNGFSQYTTSASQFVGSNVSETLAANYSITIVGAATAVPEPASMTLTAAGLLVAGLVTQRRARRPAIR